MKNLKVYHLLLFIITIIIIYLDYQWYQSIDFIENKNQQDIFLTSKGKRADDFIICHIMFGIPIFSFILIFTNIVELIIKFLNRPLKIQR